MIEIDYPTIIRWALAQPMFLTWAIDGTGKWLVLNTVTGCLPTPWNLN